MEQQNTDQLAAQIAQHFQAIIQLLGENPNREGLQKTPLRAAKALLENTRGYRQDPDRIVQAAMFEHPGSQIVVVRDIEFYSLCEHHILPFFGTITIGYIPNGKIVGLSKIGRIVDALSRRLQVQERLTRQLCDHLSDQLHAHGVIVYCQAQHLCMQMRGVSKQQANTITLEYAGDFDDPTLRAEFMRMIQK